MTEFSKVEKNYLFFLHYAKSLPLFKRMLKEVYLSPCNTRTHTHT